MQVALLLHIELPQLLKQLSTAMALCPWKPALHAGSSLTARVIPTDSANYTPKTSQPFFVGTAKRTTTR